MEKERNTFPIINYHLLVNIIMESNGQEEFLIKKIKAFMNLKMEKE